MVCNFYNYKTQMLLNIIYLLNYFYYYEDFLKKYTVIKYEYIY